MAGVRFTALQSHPLEFLECTSLTLDEFRQLGLALRGGVPHPEGDVAHGWEAADRAPVYRVPTLPLIIIEKAPQASATVELLTRCANQLQSPMRRPQCHYTAGSICTQTTV